MPNSVDYKAKLQQAVTAKERCVIGGDDIAVPENYQALKQAVSETEKMPELHFDVSCITTRESTHQMIYEAFIELAQLNRTLTKARIPYRNRLLSPILNAQLEANVLHLKEKITTPDAKDKKDEKVAVLEEKGAKDKVYDANSNMFSPSSIIQRASSDDPHANDSIAGLFPFSLRGGKT